MKRKHSASLQEAIARHQAGHISEATAICTDILQQTPSNFECVCLLAMIHAQQGDLPSSIEMFERAATLRPSALEVRYNLAVALNLAGKDEEACKHYRKILDINQTHVDALNNYAASLLRCNHAEGALEQCEKLIRLNPDNAVAHNNRGLALFALKRFGEAIVSFDNAIILKNNYAEAYFNKGNAFLELRRLSKALLSYDAAIALQPDYAEAYNNRGNVLKNLNLLKEALSSYDKAIALKADYCEAHCNRGATLRDLKRFDEAVASYDRAVALQPDREMLLGDRLHLKIQICDWRDFEKRVAEIAGKVGHSECVLYPFIFLALFDSLALQLKVSKDYVRATYPQGRFSIASCAVRPEKIRIGYFSADFYNHATSYLMAEIFEKHDRSCFEIIGFSFSGSRNDEMAERLTRAFDKFIDVQDKSDAETAELARDYGIDIAVDLKGFTTGNRTGIFAERAAPVQVSYLGYPGTMGSEYISYLIADRVVVPQSHQAWYSEKIVYLPHCYQGNGTMRPISDAPLTRRDVRLPDDGFIFCCFNNNYKILPFVFDIWMKILDRVEGSVLWLLEDNETAAANLRKEAVSRGVEGARLVFAQRMPPANHLARHRFADLFLDTLPYNGHTTASDALWAGLPVLTCVGETFAGRVAASLLNAIGLPELVTSTAQAYEELAIELATDAAKLMRLKNKLLANRLTQPLFNSQLFARHLEAAYTLMYERYQAGLPPDHIYVPQ